MKQDKRSQSILPRPSGRGAAVFNLLTALLLLSVACVVVGFLVIYNNPNSWLNPFPPATLPAALALPSPTPTTLGELPPSWTPTVTQEATATPTPRPSATLPPTATDILQSPGEAGTPTSTPLPAGRAFLVDNGPLAIQNIVNSAQGCNWMGVTGQVRDADGNPIYGQQVQIGGSLAGRMVDQLTLTGLSAANGPGFYQFTLAEETIDSGGTLWIQLLNQSGVPKSDKVFFPTYDDCQRNQIVIDFKEAR